jgi:hypothetical protein
VENMKTPWPALGPEDTELNVLIELKFGNGEAEVYAGRDQDRGYVNDREFKRTLCAGIASPAHLSVLASRPGKSCLFILNTPFLVTARSNPERLGIVRLKREVPKLKAERRTKRAAASFAKKQMKSSLIAKYQRI